MLSELGYQVRWEVDGAATGVGLGWSEVTFVLGLDELIGDGESAVVEVEAAATQRDELAPAQTGPGRKQYEHPPARLDRLGQSVGLHQGRRDSLGRLLSPRAAKNAGVAGEDLVGDGGVQDGLEQPVRLGHR